MKRPNVSKNKLNASLKYLSIATLTALSMSMVQHASAYQKIGDLEIYQAAQNGTINIMLMLDTSGSMGISSLVLPKNNLYGSPGDVDTPLCTRSDRQYGEWEYNAKDKRTGSATFDKTAFKLTATIGTGTSATNIDYYLRGCSLTGSTSGAPNIVNGRLVEDETGKFDRLSRLKFALIKMIENNSLNDNVRIGLGHFSSKTNINVGNTTNKLVDGHSGTILVPVGQMTDAHRIKLIRAIAAFESVDTNTRGDATVDGNLKSSSTAQPNIYKAASGTPAAHAYAEAGAYMMGTNTGIRPTALPTKIEYLYDGLGVFKEQNNPNSDYVYYVCVSYRNNTTTNSLGTIPQCDNAWNEPFINPLNGIRYGTWYDSTNQQIGPNIAVYKPNGQGGWAVVTPEELKAEVGPMTKPWDTHRKLPIGWRYGGWMKVGGEPLDIEAVALNPYSHSAGGASNWIGYRTNPFALNFTPATRTCPDGMTMSADQMSCTKVENRKYYAEYKNMCPTITIGGRNYQTTRRLVAEGEVIYDVYNRVVATNTTDAYCVTQPVPYTVSVNSSSPFTAIDENYGGFAYSAADTKSGNNYIRGASLASASCSANGIYFLTDGAPNSTKDTMAKAIMNHSLTSTYSINAKPTGGLVSPKIQSSAFEGETGGWEWIGEYAKKLYNPSTNPAGVQIKTAVAGFGSSFAGLSMKDNPFGGIKQVYDCDSTTNVDIKNACKWGYSEDDPVTKGVDEALVRNASGQVTEQKGYGNGGFFYAQTATDIQNSIADFAMNMDNQLPTAPAGTISIPEDPFGVGSQQSVAYLPMLQPDVTSTSTIWQGNLKKYSIVGATIFGKNSANAATQLYTGSGLTFNKAIRDLWAKTHAANGDNSPVTEGGMYAHLKAPATGSLNNVRTVYIEDGRVDVNNGGFKKLGVNAAGKLTVNDAPIDDNSLTDFYTPERMTHLVRFMGFDGDVTKPYANVTLTANGNKIMGGVVHSAPASVTYSAALNTDGTIGTTRKEYMLFGSMDGALHLVNSADYTSGGEGGQEKMAIITKTMLTKQPEALSASNGTEQGQPKFGVDAPWLVSATYVYKYTPIASTTTASTSAASTTTASTSAASTTTDSNQIVVGIPKITTTNASGQSVPVTPPNRAAGMLAYGGFRLGAKGLYGIDLTNVLNTTDNAPRLLFSIDENSTGFNRISHIWAKPTKARIKKDEADIYGTDVLIFGGGYDMCYEDPTFQVGKNTGTDATCNNKVAADGNALYIINARTGALIWQASSTDTTASTTTASTTTASTTAGTFRQVPDMKHSIVGEVETVDADNDGFMDHIYFADLGGQVFRADFLNAGIKNPTSGFENHAVVKLFSDNDRGQYASRFFEKPVVGFHDGALLNADGTQRNANGRFALVNVISGDRSSPLSTMRDTLNRSDRLYAIFDEDMTKTTNQLLLAASQNYLTQNLTVASLQELGDTKTNTKTETDVKKKKGWYYPLIRFDNRINVLHTKGVGKMERLSGLAGDGSVRSYLYSMVYNPDIKYATNTNPCAAQIKGGSEMQSYCLPYGICSETSDGTAGYTPAGQGIKELALGPLDAESKIRTLVSTMTINERYHFTLVDANGTSLVAGKQDENDTGTPVLESLCENTLGCQPKRNNPIGQDATYRLIPRVWYDLALTSVASATTASTTASASNQ